MKKIAGLLVVVMVVQNLLAVGDKYADSFLKTGTGVREISLGGATVSSADASASFYWNPAILMRAQKMTTRFMHSEEFGGVLNLDHISITLPNLHEYHVSVGLIRSAVDDIPLVKESSLVDIGRDGIGPNDDNYQGPDADGSEGNGKLDAGEQLDFGKIGRFGTSETAFFISAAKTYSDKIDVGLSMKSLYKDLYNSTAFGVGLDAGILYRLRENITFGAILTDFTTTYLFWNDGEKEVIAPQVKIGGSYNYKIGQVAISPMLGLNASFDGEKHNSLLGNSAVNIKTMAGLEVVVKEMVALRFGQDENENFHLGAGISTAYASLNYGLSLGGTYNELGKSHQIGLIFSLEKAYGIIKNNI